jgi:hypothetical protein
MEDNYLSSFLFNFKLGGFDCLRSTTDYSTI